MVKGPVKKVQTDVDALSMHTTPDDYEYDDLPVSTEGLPTYADSEAAASSSMAAAETYRPEDALIAHAPPQDEYAPAPIANNKWNTVVLGKNYNPNETTVRIEERLMDPYNMYAYVMDYLRMIPPKPIIHIEGSHYETVQQANSDKKSKEMVKDFDIRLSLEPMLRRALEADWWEECLAHNDEKTFRGTILKQRVAGHTQGVQLSDETAPDLKEWCEQFCASPAKVKAFRISREVAGLDQALLESLVANMIRATDYRGRLNVTFPVDRKNVDIYSPHRYNHWRTSWVRYLFYFTMLWIITWPILFIRTKWWTVYTVRWNFSITKPHPTDPNKMLKRYACMSERDWFELQENYIRNLVLNRFNGEADCSPETLSDFNRRPTQQTRRSTGNANVDSAIDVVTQGANIFHGITRGGLGTNASATAWGYDT